MVAKWVTPTGDAAAGMSDVQMSPTMPVITSATVLVSIVLISGCQRAIIGMIWNAIRNWISCANATRTKDTMVNWAIANMTIRADTFVCDKPNFSVFITIMQSSTGEAIVINLFYSKIVEIRICHQ